MAASIRENSGWKPEWNEAFRGWAINFIRKNRWRCESLHEFEDLLQDAYLVFRRVRASYPQITEPKHFMALYKTAMSNALIDKARYKKQMNEVLVCENIYDEQSELPSERIVGENNNEGYLKVLLDELPEEAKLVLKALSDDKILEALRKSDSRSALAKQAGIPKQFENLNMKFCILLKLPKGTDLVGPLKEALSK